MFTASQSSALVGLSIFLSIFSFLGSALIIFSYFRFKQLQKFSFRLIMFMSCADAANSFSYFFGAPDTGTGLCYIQGMFGQTFQISSIIWTTVISYTLWKAVVKREDTLEDLKKFLIVGFVLPASVSLLPLFTTSYINTGAWCWIDQTDVGTVWRFLLFYVPLWTCIAFNAYTYYIVIRSMNELFKTQNTEVPKKYRSLIQRLKLYPLILVGCWLFATINRFQNAVAPDSPQYWLFVMQVLGSHTQGFFNSIAYGMNPNVREAWIEVLEEYPRLECVVRALKTKEVSGAKELQDSEDDNALVEENKL